MNAQAGFAGTEVYNIQRIRRLDGKPLILDLNLFREDLVPGLTPESAAPAGSLQLP